MEAPKVLSMFTLRLHRNQPFDLDATLSCGQVFRWEYGEGWWTGVVAGRVIRARQNGRELRIDGAEEAFVREYFQLDTDLEAILSEIDRDPLIHRAIGSCRGLRIANQEPWECLISYLIATNSNIPVIRQRIEALCRELGEEIRADGRVYFAFPTPEVLGAEACRGPVERCRLGYRETYLRDTACRLGEEPGWVDRIASLPDDEAREALMAYRGIGPKAADCILLFGFRRYEAFPVDVWIRKILARHYPQALAGTGSEAERIRRFAREYFGPYAGYAQEYLFCARRDLQVPVSQAAR